ncbi:MAG: ATP-dependent DNA helicase RecG [Muribaculaceae bacterium]|nr:ATP-dependent DNA helicase RecG [Muribaculaceae bacterium]
MNSLRNFDIKYIKGIGSARADLLRKHLDIHSAYDLLRHFPLHYVDRTSIYKITDLAGDMPSIQLRGRFLHFNIVGEGRKRRLVGVFSDDTGIIEVLWFQGISRIKDAFRTGNEYVIFGKPTYFERTGAWSISHPEVDPPGALGSTQGLRPVYSIPDPLRRNGITSRMISGWINNIFIARPIITDYLPASTLNNLGMVGLSDALRSVHAPSSAEQLNKARFRLKFDELFLIQVDMQQNARTRKQVSRGAVFTTIGRFFNRFYAECLPFQLTGAQKRVLREIRNDVRTGHQMNRLVQGDVGSGKTVVALMAMLMALDNGYQACMMAPTEILATQHFEALRQLVAPLGVNIKLLTGSTRAKERRVIHEQLADGSLHILVGTHALIEDPVRFNNLGLAVIDEQHRFGVAQRAKLWKKATLPPHVLVMTATPIPRTLAMTVYGDLDVSVIDELPPGRKPILTKLGFDDRRLDVLKALGLQLRQGRQAYIVYPLVHENEKLDLLSLEEGYEYIRDTFRDYKVGFVHGKMKPDEKDAQMALFASGTTRILVATTVIEVGVNVPNATTMIIENAERFGLSQLHQLRGRVGRGGDQSYCVLMTRHNISKETRRRLELMTQTTDGFLIAEADMKWRGPGDIEGTMQSGIPFDLKIANLATDGQIIALASREAEKLLELDFHLVLPEHAAFARALNLSRDSDKSWSRIS